MNGFGRKKITDYKTKTCLFESYFNDKIILFFAKEYGRQFSIQMNSVKTDLNS